MKTIREVGALRGYNRYGRDFKDLRMASDRPIVAGSAPDFGICGMPLASCLFTE